MNIGSYAPHKQLHQMNLNKIRFGAEDNLLCPRIAMTILMYDMTNFRKFLCLSPNWHYLVI